ncbi:MAG: hypothetical protein HKN56_11400 [Gammaproteobacteria bacterium]|nr:hypothetical protein [Gammaproteobacteria bacterium]NND55560.1 hypothetical protein [Gammaproteobacteria bacterium]
MADDNHSVNRARARSTDFSVASFFWRLLLSIVLVFATYNPTELSAFHWITGAEDLGAIHFLVAVLLFIGWVILWVATWRSLETLGVVLGAVALGALVWVLIDLGWLDTSTSEAITWVVLVCLALLLSIGLSWSHIWRRLTGQLEVDEG